MYKVRVISTGKVVEFNKKNDAFDWVRETQRSNTMFQLLEYDSSGNLEAMNRFTFNGRRMLMENITR